MPLAQFCPIDILEIIPPDFCIYHKDRVECRGGGVFLAVHQSVPSRVIPSPPSIEVQCQVSVQINVPQSNNNLCCLFATQLSINPTIYFFSTLICSEKDVIIMGDFNVPIVNWGLVMSTTCATLSSSLSTPTSCLTYTCQR